MIFQIKAKVFENIRVAQEYYKIILFCPAIAESAKPGQFVNIKVSDTIEPFLRRPFSIHQAGNQYPETKNRIEILYAAVGIGTQLLAQKKPGEFLDIIGPLGNGFNYMDSKQKATRQILVAGGMGVAPLLFFAKRYPLNGMILIGTKTKNQILCEKDFEKLGLDVKIATDDGSRGFKGRVTELLKNVLRTTQYARRTMIYACGPHPMLQEISRISKKYNIQAQISLEEHMCCGVGACLGCVIETKQGYKRVCKEGPIFNAQEIIWGKNTL
ncbi:MAG: dihydroorotate dehydrogenase electron transfer subunit [Candidatus Omnitrophota bacterium]|nr:dihydroorotate dehydrogenase electron transfer subunit [Candidatus Omnitrophota bacterium]